MMPKPIYKIGLIACCGEKLTHKAPAKWLYVSPLFTKSRQFVESNCHEWAILSALHGLVQPDDCLHPYNYKLSDQPRDQRRAWSANVRAQVESKYCELAEDFTLVFVILA